MAIAHSSSMGPGARFDDSIRSTVVPAVRIVGVGR